MAAATDPVSAEMQVMRNLMADYGAGLMKPDSPDFQLYYDKYFVRDLLIDQTCGVLPEHFTIYNGVEGYQEYLNKAYTTFSHVESSMSMYQGPDGIVIQRYSSIPTSKATGKTASCHCVSLNEWYINSEGKIYKMKKYYGQIKEMVSIMTP